MGSTLSTASCKLFGRWAPSSIQWDIKQQLNVTVSGCTCKWCWDYFPLDVFHESHFFLQTSHLLQPLNKGCFSPLSRYYRGICSDCSICSEFMVFSRHQVMNKATQLLVLTTTTIITNLRIVPAQPPLSCCLLPPPCNLQQSVTQTLWRIHHWQQLKRAGFKIIKQI